MDPAHNKIPSFLRKKQGTGEKGTAIERTDGAEFGGGQNGRVQETLITVSGPTGTRDVSLVVKKFPLISYYAENAFKNYALLKSAGLRVPPTYRLDKEKHEIVMTNYNTHGRVALSGGPLNQNEHDKDVGIETISNFEALISDLQDQGTKAAEHSILLNKDAFFMIVPKTASEVEAQVVVGDLDNTIKDTAPSKEEIKSSNYNQIFYFLREIASKYGSAELQARVEELKTVLWTKEGDKSLRQDDGYDTGPF